MKNKLFDSTILFLIAILIVSTVLITISAINITPAPAAGQTPQQQQTGTDGNLTATINGDSFRAGDTIRINGTVAKEGRDINSRVIIGVIDPENFTVERAEVFANPTGGNFEHEFIAGIVRQFDPDGIMRESGNYTVRITHTPPYLYGQEIPREQVNFTFAYEALASSSSPR